MMEMVGLFGLLAKDNGSGHKTLMTAIEVVGDASVIGKEIKERPEKEEILTGKLRDIREFCAAGDWMGYAATTSYYIECVDGKIKEIVFPAITSWNLDGVKKSNDVIVYQTHEKLRVEIYGKKVLGLKKLIHSFEQTYSDMEKNKLRKIN